MSSPPDTLSTSMEASVVTVPTQPKIDELIAKQTPSLRDRLSWLMILIAALAPGWMLIQAVTIFVSHEAHGLSWIAFLLTAVFSVIWLFYGYFVVEGRDWVIISSSISTLITSILVLVGIKMYGNVVPTAHKKRPVWLPPLNGVHTKDTIIPLGYREFNVYLHRQ